MPASFRSNQLWSISSLTTDKAWSRSTVSPNVLSVPGWAALELDRSIKNLTSWFWYDWQHYHIWSLVTNWGIKPGLEFAITLNTDIAASPSMLWLLMPHTLYRSLRKQRQRICCWSQNVHDPKCKFAFPDSRFNSFCAHINPARTSCSFGYYRAAPIMGWTTIR